MNAEKESAMKRNDAFINDLPGELLRIEGEHKVSDNCIFLLGTIQVAQNKKLSNTGGIAELIS